MSDFDGQTYNRERDRSRLSVQLYRVKAVLGDGNWRTLEMISRAINAPEASISARIRDLRKPKFGSYQIERRFVRRGLWEYRMVVQQALELVA